MEEVWKNLCSKSLENEVWKKCKDAYNYEVSNLGRVKCLKYTKGSYYKKRRLSNYYETEF